MTKLPRSYTTPNPYREAARARRQILAALEAAPTSTEAELFGGIVDPAGPARKSWRQTSGAEVAR